MGYPVAAYRNVRPPQGPPSSSGGYQKPPPPANDNARVPKPANDNWRPFPKPKPPIPPFGRKVPPGVAAIARRSPGIARFVTRGIPVFGTALLIYDLYRLVERWSPGIYAYFTWEVVKDCGRIGFAHTGQSTICSVTIGSHTGPNGNGVPPNANYISFMQPQYTRNVYGDWNFKQAREIRRRTISAPGFPRMPQVVPYQVVRTRTTTKWVPAVDPFLVPGTEPLLPTPSPLPRAVPPPSTAAEGDWSQRGYTFRPRPSAQPQPYHPHKPTPPREKEKKSRLRKGFAIVLKGGYAATEFKDAVEALVDGVKTPWGKLPPAFPEWVLAQLPKNASIYDKMALAVKYWGELDPSQAVINLGVNGIIDLAVGVPQGKLTEFANQHGFVHGPYPFGGPINL